MKIGDVNEKTLAKSGLFTDEEMKFARVHFNLPKKKKTEIGLDFLARTIMKDF